MISNPATYTPARLLQSLMITNPATSHLPATYTPARLLQSLMISNPATVHSSILTPSYICTVLDIPYIIQYIPHTDNFITLYIYF